MKKSVFAGFCFMAAIFILMAGCGKKEGGAQSGAAAPVQFKLSHPNQAESPYGLAAQEFKKLIEAKSAGKYEIAIFPNNTLGNQEEVTEAIQLGTIDFVVTSDDLLVPLVPDFGALGMPFVFRDFEHVYKTVTGPVGQELSKKLESKGVLMISVFENGFRHITNNRKPVVTPDDLKGLKIRALRSRPCMALFEACGSTVANISFSELYSALQLGTVEAQENPFPNIFNQKFYEVQKYLSVSGHIHTAEPMIMSKATYNRLAPEEQQYFREIGNQVTKWAYDEAQKQADDYRTKLQSVIAINEIDMNAFQPVIDKVYAQFPEYAALANQIRQAK